MTIEVEKYDIIYKGYKHSKKHSLGIYEHIELLNFLKYLKKEYNYEEIVLCGYSIGGTTCLLASLRYEYLKV